MEIHKTITKSTRTLIDVLVSLAAQTGSDTIPVSTTLLMELTGNSRPNVLRSLKTLEAFGLITFAQRPEHGRTLYHITISEELKTMTDGL